jgi:RHS repeat-associated protein
MPVAGTPEEEHGLPFELQFGKTGTEAGEFKEPQSLVVTSTGDEYVVDTGNHRIEEFGAQGEFIRAIGSELLKEPRGIALNSSGDIWVANTGGNQIDEYTPTGTVLGRTGGGELKGPQSIAIDAKGDVWVTDTGNNRVVEYEEKYKKVTAFGTVGAGEEQFKEPQGIAVNSEGNIYIADTGNNRIDEYTSAAKHVRNFGKEGTGTGQLKAPHGLAGGSGGDVWVADTGNNRIQEFGPTGTFLSTFGAEGSSEGKLKGPQGIAIDSEGDEWVADTANSNVQEWGTVSGNGNGYGTGPASPHDTQTIYYTAGPNSKVASCGEHPEWAALPCQTQPAAQPEDSLPNLPTTTTTYNMWDEPETITSTSGTTTRTTSNIYDAAGRLKTSTTTSSVGTALPAVTNEYSSTTGALVKQCDNEGKPCTEGKPKTITSVYNTLGQLETYTDADGNIASYEYDIDGRTHKANDGKGTQTYTYNENGMLSELVDSSAEGMKFTATYDVEGNMLSEGYPNGMSANYIYNATGAATSLEYLKTTHCTENCKWFTDSVIPSIHGQWLSQTSTLSKQAYTYDAAGRLTQVQTTPVGKGCTTHIYAYDEDTNRTSLTTREPNTKGECATEGGTVEKHTYDTADRLTDSSIAYNTFGNITALPAADAGGSELKNSYYVDNQLQSQTQNEQTIGYNLDPAGRTRETVSTGKPVIADVISHYAGPTNSPAWTINTSSETTRNIPGIDGQLTAVQNNLETPVLQLTNLHGDIIATAYKSETATALASKADTSEFGVPTTSLPPKYSWLGTLELPTELPSGVIAMGARSYVPQLGRFLQPDPIPGGSANAYTYTYGNPVNSVDPSGEYTATAEEWSYNGSARIATAAAEVRAAEIAAARAVARAAEEAAARIAAEEAARWEGGGGGYPGEGEEGGEEEWYEEEEGEYEYASYNHGAESGKEEAHIENGVLYQSLGGEEGAGEGTSPFGSALPLCKAGVEGPCTRTVDGAENGYCTHSKHPSARCHKNPAWRKKHGYPPEPGTPTITGKDVACTLAGGVGEIFGVGILVGGVCVVAYP